MQTFLEEKQRHFLSLTDDNFKEDVLQADIQNIGDL